MYNKCTVRPYTFSVIDNTLASNNALRFRKNLLEKIFKKIMKIDNKTRDEKLQCLITREAAKISPLSSRKVDKGEYCTGKEVLPHDKSRIIE